MWHCSHLLLSAVLRPVLRRHCCWALGADSFDVKRAFIHSASNTFVRHSAANPSHTDVSVTTGGRTSHLLALLPAPLMMDAIRRTGHGQSRGNARPTPFTECLQLHSYGRADAVAYLGFQRLGQKQLLTASVRYANYVCVCHKLLFY